MLNSENECVQHFSDRLEASPASAQVADRRLVSGIGGALAGWGAMAGPLAPVGALVGSATGKFSFKEKEVK
jgi:hypothetical protein